MIPCSAFSALSVTPLAVFTEDRPRSALDTIIASVAEANEWVVATDNEKDFADIQIVNPLRERER